jgi:hypothetical protein
VRRLKSNRDDWLLLSGDDAKLLVRNFRLVGVLCFEGMPELRSATESGAIGSESLLCTFGDALLEADISWFGEDFEDEGCTRRFIEAAAAWILASPKGMIHEYTDHRGGR